MSLSKSSSSNHQRKLQQVVLLLQRSSGLRYYQSVTGFRRGEDVKMAKRDLVASGIFTSDEVQYLLDFLKDDYDKLAEAMAGHQSLSGALHADAELISLNKSLQEKLLGHKVKKYGYSHS
jgi:hypothetical protein